MSDLRARLESALDGYRIEREVAQGGMAIVFLAEDLKHNRRYCQLEPGCCRLAR